MWETFPLVCVQARPSSQASTASHLQYEFCREFCTVSIECCGGRPGKNATNIPHGVIWLCGKKGWEEGDCQLLGVVWVMGTCTHTHTHTHAHTHAHTHTHTHTHAHTHTHTHAHTHTCAHTCTHIHHAYTHILMHIPADVTTEGWLQQCILQAEAS